MKPVEDLHQRALASAILAKQSVDFAGTEGQIDAIVGEDARESLYDVPHFQSVLQPQPLHEAVTARY
jgi:hypothetical protein